MSESQSTTPAVPVNPPATLSQPSLAVEPPAGFALPEAVLHSIPLPTEFEVLVQSAREENKVESILPGFFNPLFRRQGVVNKHTIQALESVGQSLASLAREIEGRDRVLEQLTSHLNAHGQRTQQGYSALAQFTEQLAWQVGEMTRSQQNRLVEETQQLAKIEARLEQETAGSRLRTDTLVATSRSIGRRLSDLQAATLKVGERLNEISALNGQRENQLREEIHRLSEAGQRTSAQLEEISKHLNNTAGSIDQREATLRDQIHQISAADLRTTSQLAELGRQIEGMQQAIQATGVNLTEVQTLAAAARAGAGIAAERVGREGREAIADLEARISSRVTEEMNRLRQEQNERLNKIETRLTEQIKASNQIDPLVSAIRANSKFQKTLSDDYNTLRKDLGNLAEISAVFQKRIEALDASLGATKTACNNLLPALQTQLERLAKSHKAGEQKAAAAEALATVQSAQTADSDGLYVALEARFRGPRALIRERQSRYLPTVSEARTRVSLLPPSSRDMQRADSPLEKLRVESGVLDLGCGRGEWLDLLKANGVSSLGVDQNKYFLESCRQGNLAVVDADVIEFLRTAPDESVAVVTCFHVIEHLPVPVFQEMVRQVLRVLRRGGTAIFETPNPANVLTSSLNFLLDPTHLRPVHPEFARLVLESTGFSGVHLEFMSPYAESYKVGKPGDAVGQRFDEHFYGPQDYAVIGIKP